MKAEAIRVPVDEADADYYRAVWYLAGALMVIGVRDRVVPTLLELFNNALAERDGGERQGH